MLEETNRTVQICLVGLFRYKLQLIFRCFCVTIYLFILQTSKKIIYTWHAVHKPRYRYAKTAAPQLICFDWTKSLNYSSEQLGTVLPDKSGNIQQANISMM